MRQNWDQNTKNSYIGITMRQIHLFFLFFFLISVFYFTLSLLFYLLIYPYTFLSIIIIFHCSSLYKIIKLTVTLGKLSNDFTIYAVLLSISSVNVQNIHPITS